MGSTKRIQYQPHEIQLADMYKALGHPARLRILELLISNESLFCKQLQYSLQLSAPTVSRHLQLLFDNNLIGSRVVNNMTFYIVNPLSLKHVKNYLKLVVESAKEENNDYSKVYFKPFNEANYLSDRI